mmetsp:Transcript_61396/g.174385  ORF Transcript_61396/g.174385 Transcript_61396/m.174385 type:complete len:235 (-) Transcript_61396:9-713(-)
MLGLILLKPGQVQPPVVVEVVPTPRGHPVPDFAPRDVVARGQAASELADGGPQSQGLGLGEGTIPVPLHRPRDVHLLPVVPHCARVASKALRNRRPRRGLALLRKARHLLDKGLLIRLNAVLGTVQQGYKPTKDSRHRPRGVASEEGKPALVHALDIPRRPELLIQLLLVLFLLGAEELERPKNLLVLLRLEVAAAVDAPVVLLRPAPHALGLVLLRKVPLPFSAPFFRTTFIC